MELDLQVSTWVALGCESWTSFASSCSSTAVQRTLSLWLCPSTAVETAIAQCTGRWAMAKEHRLNTSIVLGEVHGLSGLFRTVSAVGSSLFRPLPHPPSLISHFASMDVKQNVYQSGWPWWTAVSHLAVLTGWGGVEGRQLGQASDTPHFLFTHGTRRQATMVTLHWIHPDHVRIEFSQQLSALFSWHNVYHPFKAFLEFESVLSRGYLFSWQRSGNDASAYLLNKSADQWIKCSVI